MTAELKSQVRAYTEFFVSDVDPINVEKILDESVQTLPTETVSPHPPKRPLPAWVYAVAAASVVLVLVGGLAWLTGDTAPVVTQVSVTTTMVEESAVPTEEQVINQMEFLQSFLHPSLGGGCSGPRGGPFECDLMIATSLIDAPHQVLVEVRANEDGDPDEFQRERLLGAGARDVLEDELAALYSWALSIHPTQTEAMCGAEFTSTDQVLAWSPGYAAHGPCGEYLGRMVDEFLVATASTAEDVAVPVARSFWSAVLAGDAERAVALSRPPGWAEDSPESVANLVAFLTALFSDQRVLDQECRAIGSEVRDGHETTVVECTFVFDHSLFGQDTSGVFVARVPEAGVVIHPDPSALVAAQIEPLYEWASTTDPTSSSVCAREQYVGQLVASNVSSPVAYHPACGEYLTDLGPAYRRHIVQTFWQAMADGDADAASRIVVAGGFAPGTTEGHANLVGFFSAFAWGGDVECDFGPADRPELEFDCTLRPDHPLFPDTLVVESSVSGGRVFNWWYFNEFHRMLDELIPVLDGLHQWALETSPDATTDVCEAPPYTDDGIEYWSANGEFSSWMFNAHQGPDYVLDSICGSYLAGLVDEYLAGTTN